METPPRRHWRHCAKRRRRRTFSSRSGKKKPRSCWMPSRRSTLPRTSSLLSRRRCRKIGNWRWRHCSRSRRYWKMSARGSKVRGHHGRPGGVVEAGEVPPREGQKSITAGQGRRQQAHGTPLAAGRPSESHGGCEEDRQREGEEAWRSGQ